MNDFRVCPVCRKWGWFDRPSGNHVCAPVWEARLAGEDDFSWITVHASLAEDAAEEFAEQCDRDGEYGIVKSGGADVEVRKPGETEITRFEITAETVPQYSAYKKLNI